MSFRVHLVDQLQNKIGIQNSGSETESEAGGPLCERRRGGDEIQEAEMSKINNFLYNY